MSMWEYVVNDLNKRKRFLVLFNLLAVAVCVSLLLLHHHADHRLAGASLSHDTHQLPAAVFALALHITIAVMALLPRKLLFKFDSRNRTNSWAFHPQAAQALFGYAGQTWPFFLSLCSSALLIFTLAHGSLTLPSRAGPTIVILAVSIVACLVLAGSSDGYEERRRYHGRVERSLFLAFGIHAVWPCLFLFVPQHIYTPAYRADLSTLLYVALILSTCGALVVSFDALTSRAIYYHHHNYVLPKDLAVGEARCLIRLSWLVVPLFLAVMFGVLRLLNTVQ